MAHGMPSARSPHIDGGEQEQPDHVDEMPVPGGELEAEVLGRREMLPVDAQEADREEDSADDDVGAVEARRHEEGGAVDVASESEGGVAVLVGLNAGEQGAERDRQPQAHAEALAVAVEKRVTRP